MGEKIGCFADSRKITRDRSVEIKSMKTMTKSKSVSGTKLVVATVVLLAASSLAVAAFTQRSAVRPQSRLPSAYNEKKQPVNPIGTDLYELWGINTSKNKLLENSGCEIADKVDQIIKQYTTTSNYQSVEDNIEGVKVIFLIPNNLTVADPTIKGGISITKSWLKYAQKYFGQFPCKILYTLTYGSGSGGAGGSPGSIYIGGFGGFNDPYLLSHELTHSYFWGGQTSETAWLAEGPSSAIFLLMLDDIYDEISWNTTDFPWIPPDPSTSNVLLNSFNEYTIPGWAKYDKGKVYLEKNACDLEKENENNFDTTHEINASWGNLLLIDLALKFGKQNVIDSLRAVYEKYRYTNEKIIDEDFYKAFLYYVAKKDKEKLVADSYAKAKQLLDIKLCQ